MLSFLSDFEHAVYIGNFMSGILYGIDLVMYTLTIKLLYTKGNTSSRNSRLFFTTFSTVLLVLLTIDVAVNAVWCELMWIEGRNMEGGVPAFVGANIAMWYQTVGSVSAVGMIFIGDAFLIYRLFVIYGRRLLVLAVPVLAYLAAFALAIIELVFASKPGGNFFSRNAIKFGVSYYSITISLNVIVTTLIVVRLRHLGKRISDIIGKDAAKTYTGISAMLIESAAPYSIVGIMFLIPYARESDLAIGFGQVWGKTTCLGPQLIVLRVVTGRAWTRKTVTQAEGRSKVAFKTFSTHRDGELDNDIGVSSHMSYKTEKCDNIEECPA